MLVALDDLDPAGAVPVLASHAAYRLGSSTYNLDAEAVRRVASRGGVVGLTVGERLVRDGGAPRPRSRQASVDLLCRHIDRIVAPLRARYGEDAATQILGRNMLNLLRGYWGDRRPSA